MNLALTCKALPDFSDMETYTRLALQGGISVSPPPGYPLFLRFIYHIFGPRNYTAVFVVQGLISTVTVWLIFLAAEKVSNTRSALIAAGVSAIYPNFLVYNLLTMSESLGIFFSVSILLLMVSSAPEKIKPSAAAPLLIVGCAVRPVLLYFWPGMLLGLKRRMIFVISTLVLISPWIVYGIATGKSTNRPGRAFYKTYNPRSDGRQFVRFSDTPLERSDLPNAVYIREAFRFIVNNKWKTVNIMYNKAAMIFSRGWDEHFMAKVIGASSYRRAVMIYAFVPIMLLGFGGMIVTYDRRNRLVAFLVASYLLAFILLAIFKVRYRVLIEPMLIIYGAILIESKLLECLKRLFTSKQGGIAGPEDGTVSSVIHAQGEVHD
ncbi:MAG: glycosyltransferase family 39 protein [bacterium]|nr:MAG: glycosyltransferase family 39 protein [bacterium]